MALPPRTRLALGAIAAVALGGCSAASSGPPSAQTLTAATSHGLDYSLRVTTSGSQQCLSASYRSALPGAKAGSKPVGETSHVCGPPAAPGHPVLVEAQASSESLVTDVSFTGCGKVLAGPSHKALHLLVTRCTTGRPTFRVTILPKARTLVIAGIPGVPVINFPRHVCRVGICVKPLA